MVLCTLLQRPHVLYTLLQRPLGLYILMQRPRAVCVLVQIFHSLMQRWLVHPASCVLPSKHALFF